MLGMTQAFRPPYPPHSNYFRWVGADVRFADVETKLQCDKEKQSPWLFSSYSWPQSG